MLVAWGAMQRNAGFTLIELMVVMLITISVGTMVVIYFPQESLVVNQAAQGFEQQVLRARIEAMRSNRPAGVWFTEGDVNPDVDGVQPGYVVFVDVNGSGFAGKSGDVGGDYKPEASGMCKKPDDVDCDQALYVGIFHPQGASRKVGEGVFSGVQPVNWSCSGKSAASQKGIELIYDPQGHFVGSNGTVAFGSFKDAGGSRKVNSPAQFVIIDTVGSIRRGEDSKGQECL